VDPLQIKAQSSLIFSEKEVDAAIDRIAYEINTILNQQPLVVMCVMSGGLYLCGKILARLNMPIELDYVQVNRYRGNLTGGDIHWTKLPSLDIRNKTVILMDDILDEGVTLRAAYDQCAKLGASRVLTAVLTDKENGQIKPIHADFLGLKVPNRYVFGCGMDIHGWWRNLSEIRAI
jgi:hypoxanthine phosphoribosyltransferase